MMSVSKLKMASICLSFHRLSTTGGYWVVMCDISKKYRIRDNFVDIVIVSIFDTALADFDIYRKGNILR